MSHLNIFIIFFLLFAHTKNANLNIKYTVPEYGFYYIVPVLLYNFRFSPSCQVFFLFQKILILTQNHKSDLYLHLTKLVCILDIDI